VKVTFYGVRGAVPSPGPETVRYGGNTSCVAITTAEDDLMVLDSGTGIIGLGKVLLKTPFGRGQGKAAMLLTHAHWDHIQGFPFFPPIFIPGNRFTVFGPGRSSNMLESILEGQVNPHFSPLYTMKNLGANFELVAMNGEPGGATHSYQQVQVSAVRNPHGHATCLAYRLEQHGRAVVYAPDAGYPAGGASDAAIALYRGADLLIHDATYTPEDRALRINRGYSSFEDAANAALRAQVRRLALFHYDQDYTDEQIDDCWRRCRAMLDAGGGGQIELIAAREGLTVDI
jgi:phosphoribosyl 1,2-cyclic phosphodiesterase